MKRLRSLAPLNDREAALVLGLGSYRQGHLPGAELFGEGFAMGRPKVLLSGWAARCRVMPDGRRQIFTFVLPGDAIGLCHRVEPVALSTTVGLTKTVTADASALAEAAFDRSEEFENIAKAVSIAATLEETSLLDHIVRLGRMTAYERMAHLFLELRWRLAAVGLGGDRRFPMPLTQEVLADALGLSIVHVNRTLQQLRREGLIEAHHGYVEILRPEVLVTAADFRPPQPTRRAVASHPGATGGEPFADHASP